MKAGPGRSFVTSGLEHLLSFFSPRVGRCWPCSCRCLQVESCSGGKYSGSFSTGQVNKELGGRPLMEVGVSSTVQGEVFLARCFPSSGMSGCGGDIQS